MAAKSTEWGLRQSHFYLYLVFLFVFLFTPDIKTFWFGWFTCGGNMHWVGSTKRFLSIFHILYFYFVFVLVISFLFGPLTSKLVGSSCTWQGEWAATSDKISASPFVFWLVYLVKLHVAGATLSDKGSAMFFIFCILCLCLYFVCIWTGWVKLHVAASDKASASQTARPWSPIFSQSLWVHRNLINFSFILFLIFFLFLSKSHWVHRNLINFSCFFWAFFPFKECVNASKSDQPLSFFGVF